MWKKIVVIGGTAAIIGGAGTAAFASSATATPTPSPSSSSATSDSTAARPDAGRHQAGANRMRGVVHATWVTQNRKTRTFTTHDAIRGQVSAVSPTSITVRAADSTTETYLVSSKTKVFTRAARTQVPGTAAPRTAPARTAATISEVKAGDTVLVAGTGTTALTAVRVVDIQK
jgi:hypothetical protein